jgi:hypothetical protein
MGSGGAGLGLILLTGAGAAGGSTAIWTAGAATTGASIGGASAGAAALAAFLVVVFFVETFAIKLIGLCDRSFQRQRPTRGKSSRIGRSAPGKVQFEFTDRFDFLT